MATRYTPEQLAMLERQVAHFASADHVRAEVAPWHDTTPAQRLAELERMCEVADHFLAQLTPERLARVLTREPLPDESVAILEALRKLPR